MTNFLLQASIAHADLPFLVPTVNLPGSKLWLIHRYHPNAQKRRQALRTLQPGPLTLAAYHAHPTWRACFLVYVSRFPFHVMTPIRLTSLELPAESIGPASVSVL